MASKQKDLIKKYLPAKYHTVAQQYDIPEEFLKADPEIVTLILESRAIETPKDKQNWFNLLPIMTDQQVEKLREILKREQQKLKEIEEKYRQKKNEIKKKYLLKWQKLGYLRQSSKLQQEEEEQKAVDEVEAEKLLDSL